jgi:hypothetical protein
MQTSAAFDVYESASQVLLRRFLILGGLALVGFIFVVMCGIGGGIGLAAVAIVLLGLAAVLALLVMSLDIVPFLDAQTTGKVAFEGGVLRHAEQGTAIDFSHPYNLHVLASQRIVRTRVRPKYGGEWEQSLNYDWVAFVIEQGATRLTFTQPQVSASWDSGDVAQRRANRTFLGQAPTLRPQMPEGIVVDFTRFDEFERALAVAQADGYRAQIARR